MLFNLFELDIFVDKKFKADLNPGGGGVLPKMGYTEKVHPKGVPFSGFKYTRGLGFHLLKYMKG